jgi:hypothetical protein
MKDLRAIKIGFMLAGIFALGIVTGRLTAPRPPAEPVIVSAQGRVLTARIFAVWLREAAELDNEQEEQMLPILRDMVIEMQPSAPLTAARLDIFLKTMAKIRPLLRPGQASAFDRFVKEQTDRQRRSIELKRREAEAASSTSQK